MFLSFCVLLFERLYCLISILKGYECWLFLSNVIVFKDLLSLCRPLAPAPRSALLASATPLFFYIWPCLTKAPVIGPRGIGAE